jgi:hypothetical protein
MNDGNGGLWLILSSGVGLGPLRFGSVMSVQCVPQAHNTWHCPIIFRDLPCFFIMWVWAFDKKTNTITSWEKYIYNPIC